MGEKQKEFKNIKKNINGAPIFFRPEIKNGKVYLKIQRRRADLTNDRFEFTPEGAEAFRSFLNEFIEYL